MQAGGEKCIKSGSELGNTCVGTLIIKGKFNPVPNAPHGGLCQVNEGGTQLNEALAWQGGRHGGGTADLFSGAAQLCPGHPDSASGSIRLVFSPWLQILLGSGMNLGCCDQGPVWVAPGGSGGHVTHVTQDAPSPRCLWSGLTPDGQSGECCGYSRTHSPKLRGPPELEQQNPLLAPPHAQPQVPNSQVSGSAVTVLGVFIVFCRGWSRCRAAGKSGGHARVPWRGARLCPAGPSSCPCPLPPLRETVGGVSSEARGLSAG